MFDLTGHIALVTGASRGLGFEIAQGLAQAGATVLINSRDPDHVGAAVERIAQQGLPVEALPFDIADEAAATAAVETVRQRHGRLDILVNNVGVRLRLPLKDTTPEAFATMIHANLVSTYALTRYAAELMFPNKHGRIIMLSSMAAEQARTGDIAYIAAKGGLNALTRAFACEYGPLGITCNAIAPGTFLTESNAPLLVRARKSSAAAIPVRRMGNPPEIAGPAVFLASDAASYINGHVLYVDGGRSIVMI